MTHLENAQELQRQHPATFEAPSLEELAAVKVGDSVKVCDGRERFWVTVTGKSLENNKLCGIVDNELFGNNLSFGDAIEFLPDNIYQIA